MKKWSVWQPTLANNIATRSSVISERIHEWDRSREMITKSKEVGGDLHMIRVNGVIVGRLLVWRWVSFVPLLKMFCK